MKDSLDSGLGLSRK